MTSDGSLFVHLPDKTWSGHLPKKQETSIETKNLVPFCTYQVMGDAAVPHQLVVNHFNGLQVPLIIILEHEVVVPAVTVKHGTKLARLRKRNISKCRVQGLSKLFHPLSQLRLFWGKLLNDGCASFEHLLHHALVCKGKNNGLEFEVKRATSCLHPLDYSHQNSHFSTNKDRKSIFVGWSTGIAGNLPN